ncbi:MAG: hypothetical protein WB999_17230 [Candidatus Binataceae bacterium]
MYRHLQRRCELIAKAIAAHRPHIAALMMRPANGHAPEVTEVALFADRPHRESDGTWLWRSDHIGVIATLWL